MKHYLTVFVLLLSLTMACASEATPSAGDKQSAEGLEVPIIGGPCDGCEIVFVDLPQSLSSVTTITVPATNPDANDQALQITGTVYDVEGNPAEGVIIYAYHTNTEGIYPETTDSKGRRVRHGGLRGWVQTDQAGQYTINTIRPGSYPGRSAPAHVHMHVIEPGCCTYYIEDILFTDDPLLSEQAKARLQSGRGGPGVASPELIEGVQHVTRDIFLGQNISDYPAGKP